MKINFEDIKIYFDGIQDCINALDFRIKDRSTEYRGTGKYKTKYQYENGEKVPVLNSDGSEYQYEVYDYFPKHEDDLTEEDRKFIHVYENLKDLVAALLKEVVK